VSLAQPGHWLGPVAGPGWLGLAQPMRAEPACALAILIVPTVLSVCPWPSRVTGLGQWPGQAGWV